MNFKLLRHRCKMAFVIFTGTTFLGLALIRQASPIVGYVMIFLALNDPTYTNYSRVRVVGGGVLCEILSTHAAGAVVRAMGDMRGRTLEIRFSKVPIPLD